MVELIINTRKIRNTSDMTRALPRVKYFYFPYSKLYMQVFSTYFYSPRNLNANKKFYTHV
jgi:hypothetical protein